MSGVLMANSPRSWRLQKREVCAILFDPHVDIDQGIYKVKIKVALNEKRKKLHEFSFSINMANFEAFWGVKKLSANLSFLKCVYTI